MKRRCNGFGSLIFKGEGRPWLARWVFKGSVYYKSTGEVDKERALKQLERITRPYRDAREEDAIRNLQNRLIEVQERRTKGNLLTEDIWDEFAKKLKRDDVEKGTTTLYETATTRMVAWMKTRAKYAKDINQRLAEEYLEQLTTEVGTTTYNIRLVLFKRIWRELSIEFQLCTNAWEEFKKKKATKTARRTLTENELAKILFAAGSDDMKLLIVIGLYTGLRLGDCALLKWEYVDFKKKVIRLIPIKTRKHMSAPIEIPMHAALEKMLQETPHCGEYVSEANAQAYERGHLSGTVVELFKKCGIKTSTKENGKTKLLCGFHSLRHTFVSMAINNNMNPLLVRSIVGHSSTAMTESYYHCNQDKLREGIESLPDVMCAN